jgi:hypothetical protein
MSSNVFVWLRAPLLAGAALLLANTASAQQCASNDDCDEGYACESAAKPCATIDIACAENDEECLKRAAEPCAQDQDYKECRPAACEADGDCPASMVCHAHTEMTCPTAAAGSAGSSDSGNAAAPLIAAPCQDTGDAGVCGGGGAAGGGMAGAPSTPPPTCTTTTVSQCTPRYALPCEHDADCGTGFKCVEQVQASCPGTGAGGAGATPPPDQPQPEATDAGQPMALVAKPECTMMPTGTFACELQVVPCADDSACPATFECVSNPNRVSCGSGTAMTGTAGAGSATPTPAQDAGSAIPADGQGAGGGDDPCAGANDGVPEKVCQPPNYYGYGYGGSRDDAAETPKGGTATGAPVPALADGGVAQGPTTTPPSDVQNMGSHTDGDMQAPAADSGCAVSAPGASDSTQVFATLTVFGVIAFLLRRRARLS